MRILKFFLSFFGLLLIFGLLFFFLFAGSLVDKKLNGVDRSNNPELSEKAKQLHPKLTIGDWHSDNMLWDRDPLEKISHGHVDVPRLIEGNYTLAVFDAVIKSPRGLNYNKNSADAMDDITLLAMGNRWPMRTWTSLCERALYQSEMMHKAERESNGKLQLIKTKADLQNYLNEKKTKAKMVAGILSIEGLHALEGEFENLDRLIDAGYRMMGPVHFFDNKMGGSSAGVEQGGLTEFGEKVIREMEKRSIIIDLAHSSSALIADILKIAKRPVVVSHTGVQGIKDSPRNLSDEEVRAIAANGGIIGIGFWEEAAGGKRPQDIATAIRYVVDLVGIKHVSLGSDFDGSVVVPFDCSEIIYVTDALIKEGFSDDEIDQIMGRNQIEFLLNNLPD